MYQVKISGFITIKFNHSKLKIHLVKLSSKFMNSQIVNKFVNFTNQTLIFLNVFMKIDTLFTRLMELSLSTYP